MKNTLTCYLSAFVLFFANATILSSQTINESLILLDLIKRGDEISTSDKEIDIRVNQELINRAHIKVGNSIMMRDLNNNEHSLIVTKVSSVFPQVLSFIAKHPDEPFNQVVATYAEGRLHGIWYPQVDQKLEIKYDINKKKHSLTTTNEHDEFECHTIDTAELNTAKEKFKGQNILSDQTQPLFNPVLEANDPAIDDTVTIDILILYTNDVENAATERYGFNSVESYLSQVANLNQSIFDNSQTGINFNPIFKKINYNRGWTSSNTLIRDLSNPDDGKLDEAFRFREETGADLVALIANTSGGMAWLNEGNNFGIPDRAFSVNEMIVHRTFTLAHEIGHNLGLQHSRTQIRNPARRYAGLFNYSVGYQNSDGNFATVMAYSESGSSKEVPHFSSNSITYTENQNGNTYDLGNDSTNSVLSIKQSKRQASLYRANPDESPKLSYSTNQLDFSLNQNSTDEFKLEINNDGHSPLLWNLEFSMPDLVNYAKSRTTDLLENQDAEIIYSTSFEEDEGYIAGPLPTITGDTDIYELYYIIDNGFYIDARSTSNMAIEAFITDENPSDKDQHLKLFKIENQFNFSNGANLVINQRHLGVYEYSFDFQLKGDRLNFSSGERLSSLYDYSFIRPMISNNGLNIGQYTYFADNSYEESISDFINFEFDPNNYYNFKLVIDPDFGHSIYINDSLIINEPTIISQFEPYGISFWVSGQETTANIDNFKVTKIASPTRWLSSTQNKTHGVLNAAEAEILTFKVDTQNIPSGRYELDLVLRTNDLGKPATKIPISLNVGTQTNLTQVSYPSSISLSQNYPNPFNPSTQISYSIAKAGLANLEVFNLQGQKVAELVNQVQTAGTYSITFDAANLPSGVYLYRLSTPDGQLMRKMSLIK